MLRFQVMVLLMCGEKEKKVESFTIWRKRVMLKIFLRL